MSKYVELAIEANAKQGVKELAEKNAKSFAGKIKAVIASQEASIADLREDLKEADKEVDSARGYLAGNITDWLSNLNSVKNNRDLIAEELKEAEDYLDELSQEAKLFM